MRGARLGRRQPAWVAVPALALATSAVIAQSPSLPQFRSDTTLVPIDVRVIGRDGRAVTDLTANDFRITEDGIPQVIAQYSRQLFGATPVRRGFVIVLGEGRVQAPFNSIDALIHFVRTALAPQDGIGVIGYNRWAEFTTDRATTVALLERFRSRNDTIETALETHFDGLQKNYGSPDVPEFIQRQIDDVFRGEPSAALREFAPPTRLRIITRAGSSRFTQDRFRDLVHLYGALDYLVRFDGERHLVLLTQQGAAALTARLGMIAADARVAVHTVQTGGVGDVRNITAAPSFGELPNVGIMSTQAHHGARALSAQTGGMTFWYTDPGKAFGALDAAIRADYLIGYIPSNTTWNGEYRRIDVTVKRPDVKVMFRHGYHATTSAPVWNERATMTEVRMTAARAATHLPQEIPLTLAATTTKSPNGDPRVDVEVGIEPSAVRFATEDGRHVATLEIAIWVTDGKGISIGSIAETMHLRLGAPSFSRLVRENIAYTGHVNVTGKAREVKAAVYDYDADRVGVAAQRLR